MICRFCGDPVEPDDLLHLLRCDGRQGAAEAEPEPAPHFDGETYVPPLDHERLTKQLARVKAVMLDGRWRTLRELADETGDPESSISARLRDLRKEKFGAYVIERRRRGEGRCGLFEYRLLRRETAAA